MACCIEQIYFLRNLNLVLPYNFVANLIQSYTAGSKTVSVVNGKVTPGGSYTSVHNWMNLIGEKALTCPEGTIDTFFDNIGRYAIKNYRIKSSKSTASNIFTTGIHIVLDNKEDLQKNDSLIPGNWPRLNQSDLHQRMSSIIETRIFVCYDIIFFLTCYSRF